MKKDLFNEGRFIDPDPSVGSSLHGRVSKPEIEGDRGYKYVEGAGGLIRLADCTRSITWDFQPDKKALQKLDNVIDFLLRFRAALEDQIPLVEKLRAEAKKANDAAPKPKRVRDL